VTQKIMAAKLTRLTHKIAIQLHIVSEIYTICSSCFRRPVRKLLDTPLYKLLVSWDGLENTDMVRSFFWASFETGYIVNMFRRNRTSPVNVNTQLHPMPSLRTLRISPLLIHVFKAWCFVQYRIGLHGMVLS